MSTENEIAGTAEFCRNFPQRPKKILSRENLYEYVEASFKDVSRIVFLEGGELSGKTEFLAGYMYRHPTNAVGAFLTPGDAYFYTPEYLKLVIAEQIYWLVEGKQSNFDSLDQATFQRLLLRLQRQARQAPITFVIDGLAEPNSPDHGLLTEMLAALPLGQTEFRFLISGSPALFTELPIEKYKPKTCTLVPIGPEEASAYFHDIEGLTPKDISDIRQFCRGTVGLMVKFRSLMETGNSLDKIFGDKEGGISDLLEMEWDLDSKVPGLQDLLAFVAFSNKHVSTQQLAGLCSQPIDVVRNRLSGCRFVEIDQATGTVVIRSAGEKAFLQKKLSQFERIVQERIIGELLKDPDGVEATRYLPAQLMAIGHYDDLIQRLDNNHFVRLLESERTLAALKRHSDIGFSASTKSSDELAKFKFGLSSCAVSGLTLSAATRSKIEAVIKLGDADAAIELASLAPTKEEMLKLLGATAKSLHANQIPISTDLKNQIKHLIDEVDVDALGLMATEIACDILIVDYGLAIKLFNESQKSLEKTALSRRSKSENSEQKLENDPGDKEQKLGEVQIQPSERHSRRFADAVANLVERTAASRMLMGGGDLEPKNELMLLKQWIKKRRKDPDAWRVADRALDLALKDLSRAPRIEDFRSIAVVLPYIKDLQIAERLVKRIEAQLGTQLTLGTSAESVRLEMLIERVRHRISPEESELSLISIYSRVVQIQDISIKAACLAWILYSLQQFSDPLALEEKTTLISETTKNLVESIEALLASSADHFQAAKGAIYALARADSELAFQLISQLNTKSRRDMGYVVLAHELVSSQAYVKSSAALLKCFNSINDEQQRSLTILRCLHEIARDCEQRLSANCSEAILGLWQSLRVANYRFSAAVYCYRILMSTTKDSQKEERIRNELEDIWPRILVDWVRTDTGYVLVRDLSKVNESLARSWLTKVIDFQKSSKYPSEDLSSVLQLTAALVVRCYAAVAPADCESHDPEFLRVAHLINSIPVPNQRIALWCDLGIKLHYYGKHGLSKKICIEQVQALIDQDFSQNEFVRETLIADAGPLLYLVHPATSSRLLAKIGDSSLRDQTRRDICNVMLCRAPASEPYRHADSGEYLLDQQDASGILDVLQTMEEDGHIFQIVKDICRSLVARKNEASLRRTFVRDCLHSLQELVNSKLPYAANIKHDGYKIAATAHILRATTDSRTGTIQNIQWQNLFEQARAIPNIADRVVVVAMVASCARSRSATICPNWFSEIEKELAQIPTYLDRIDRHQWIAEILEPFDTPHAIQLIRAGIALTKYPEDEQSVASKQRKMLDLAYSINPDLVDKLIDEADSDKASTTKRDEYAKQKRLKEIQKSVADDPDNQELSGLSPKEIGDICTENLGALNAYRIHSKPLAEFEKLSLIASGLSMPMAYPMWNWLIENAIRKVRGNARGDGFIRNLFEASTNAGELVLALIGKTRSALDGSSVEFDGLVRPGDREAVFARIFSWASQNDGKEIRISDPFFGPEDLEVVYRISEAAPSSKLVILTSKKYLKEKISSTSPEDAFHAAWIDRYDMDPPDVVIGAVGLAGDGVHPIHDRWIVSIDSGLRLGTSANSIGYLRMSEISDMDGNSARTKFEIIGKIVQREHRDWEGTRLQLSTFYLH